jgi:hypothetical protein
MPCSRFTETLIVRGPPGFLAALNLAAQEDCTTVSEWVRRCCLEKLKATVLRDAEPANDDVDASHIRRRA